MSLRKNTDGAVMVEFLVAFLPVMTFAMCIFQQTALYTGQLLTEHAALSAARAASVVVPDDPSRYGGEGANTVGQKRKEAIKLAAIRALGPLVQDENIKDLDVEVGGSNGQTVGTNNASIGAKAPINVTVNATFQCKVPLAAQIICDGNREFKLTASATLPNQGASFTYE